MGHIESFIRNLSNSNTAISKSCLLIIRQLSDNRQCVEMITGYPDALKQMLTAIKADVETTSVACETFDRMFKVDSDALVLQAINSELVPYLLQMLDAGQSANSSSTKALIVQVLKLMRESETYGEQIGAILDNSNVWAEFKDQKHDLFISNTPAVGYLTGKDLIVFDTCLVLTKLFSFFLAGANVAGYLTQGASVQQTLAPPPISEY